jgi:DNA-binding NtrC family response regulator
MAGRILIVDDEQSMCEMLDFDLRRRGFTTSWLTSADNALSFLKDEELDVLLTDLKLPGMNGIELCERCTANRPDVPVVVMTAFGSLETAVAAIRAGAYDFVTKPVDLDILALALERAVKHRALQEKVKFLSDAVNRMQPFGELIGDSPSMRKVYAQLARVADTETSILVTGESGTGKELVARALHVRSRRHAGPFVAINCAALPDTLLESELFGHKQGAFTDARQEHKGLFVQAKGGTLFLDEIGDLPMNLQPKLLRALEERTVRPLGGAAEIPIDVRIITATNQDLEAVMAGGRFREDLFYRLNVIRLAMPPLRERGSDILLLAYHFIDQFADRLGKNVTGISETAAEKLLEYSWPGNVRELRNAIERAIALTRYEKLVVEDLPAKIRTYRRTDLPAGIGNDPGTFLPLAKIEQRYILHVLEAVGGNRTRAAKILGLDRKTLYRKLQEYASA